MKKVLILLIFSFLTCFVTFAQNSSTVTLTAEQYNSLPSNVKERIEKENTYKTIGKWAGLGKEIGEGVNSALMAIEGSATRISETTLGKNSYKCCCVEVCRERYYTYNNRYLSIGYWRSNYGKINKLL